MGRKWDDGCLRPSPLLAIFLIVAVDVLGLTIMIPLLPFYAEKLGASPFQVGWLIGAYAACQLISGPLLGRLSDSTGRKPLLLASQVGTFIGFVITAFAPSLLVLFIARMIDGATAGNLSLAQAYISDITKPEDRAKSFGVIGIAFGIGFLIGPAVSGILANGRNSLGPRLKKSPKEGRQIVLIDESGLSTRPHKVRTWSPRGQTPILQHHFNWKSLSVIAGITFYNFYFQLHDHSIKSLQIIEFLRHLLRHVAGNLLIVWDGLPAHRSRLTQDFIPSTEGRIAAARLPAYAPELNPVEYILGSLEAA
jgi:hypothetical protein